MTLQLELPTDLEQALRTRAAQAGMDLAAYITKVVTEGLAEPEAELEPPPKASQPSRHFAERLQAWVDLHAPRPGVLDDSRESIDGGRGK